MAHEIEYTCKACDFTFSKTEGGARNGAFTCYFCYPCLKSSSTFSLYESSIIRQGMTPAPMLYRFVSEFLSQLEGDEKETELQSARDSHQKGTPHSAKYLACQQKFEQALSEYHDKINTGEIKAYIAPVPRCHDCHSTEVIEYEETFCPLCACTKLHKKTVKLID